MKKISKNDVLYKVMTTTEIEQEFGLRQGTVRQAIQRETLDARFVEPHTWLVRRVDAEKRWGSRKQKPEQGDNDGGDDLHSNRTG